jgi:hypothetical protein
MLYQVEFLAASMSAPERVAFRRQNSLPILEEFREWLDHESLKALPQSAMGKAIHYAMAQWNALTRYVEVGEAAIDNNAIEQALRGVAVGRKNFLFVGSENGGLWAAVIYSLVESCKLNGVEPYRYLRDVLQRVWTHPSSDIQALMPRLWRPPPDSS